LIATPSAATRRAFGLDAASCLPKPNFSIWEEHRDAQNREPVPPAVPGSLLAYTSGTTGLPKGVRRYPPTLEQIQNIARACFHVLGIGPGMRALVSAPLYHSAPSTYSVQAALSDAHIWLEPRFDAESTLALIEAHGITHAYLVPTMYRRLLQLPEAVRRRYDTSSLSFVASTGAPCPPTVKRDMIAWFGPVIHESYAASELGWITHIDSHEATARPGSAGKPIEGAGITIITEEGKQAAPREVGLIYARDPGMPDFTYSGNDEARRKLELDGRWTLGDMGYLDEDGYLYVVDRKADMVISGGVNIYPAEIEAMLATMSGVADSAVFGIPCEEFGESLLAVVQPLKGASIDPESVQSFLRERIAGFKVPRQVLFMDQLPREDTGKIFKRKLRDPYWSEAGRRV
jgi:long-chain acyl-CoA synthetase